MPARPSSAALKLAFSRRSANGDRASISRHHATVSCLEALERHDRVDEPHLERLLGRRTGGTGTRSPCAFLGRRGPRAARAEAAVEGADARAGLAEAGVLGGDRQVADEVQHVAAADRVAGDHRDHRLGQPADLDVQVGDVEAPDAGTAGVVLVSSRCRRARAGRRPSRTRRRPRRSGTITPTSVSSRASSNALRDLDHVCGRNALRTSGRSIVIFAIPSSGSATSRSGCRCTRRRRSSRSARLVLTAWREG